MANTYTQLYVQIIFAVQGRENVIVANFREQLEKYICGIISNDKCKALVVYCNPDHTHLLVGLDTSISIAKLVSDIKANSSKWINQNKLVLGHFNWQKGYGAFSYSKSQIDSVIKYILNQPLHHQKQTFRNEYLSILKKLEIDYNEAYLFDWDE